jgi:proteic killer suppression protein
VYGYDDVVGGYPLIASFGDTSTRALFDGSPKKAFKSIPPAIHTVALRKLDMLNAAAKLDDLKSPPGNRLEALKDDLLGFHSIRVNDQWRLVFRWQGSEAFEVQIIDYH